ncbi:7369_t:CDS:2 [Funneliformis caledonium]|uniref:7369_t:CDS:1 n=1 Tax=Funneliformis caledonium TaxID=1117310 RepID=A0A9N9FEG7_9GLOM|nr:7369_t:CDS:2 [Funneliformis caledonium]
MFKVFEQQFQALLETFPNTGMQLTQHVESINAIVYKAISFSSTMADVVEVLDS